MSDKHFFINIQRKMINTNSASTTAPISPMYCKLIALRKEHVEEGRVVLLLCLLINLKVQASQVCVSLPA